MADFAVFLLYLALAIVHALKAMGMMLPVGIATCRIYGAFAEDVVAGAGIRRRHERHVFFAGKGQMSETAAA